MKSINKYNIYESLFDGFIDTSTDAFYSVEGAVSLFDPVLHSHPYILSPYDCSQQRSRSESTQLNFIDSVQGFDTLTHTISFIIAICIALLANCHFRLNGYLSSGPSGSGLWTVISTILKNPAQKVINYVSKFLLTLLSLFAFLVGLFIYVNLIKSGQVSIYRPRVYHTLQDIILDSKSIVIIDQAFRVKLREDHTNADSQVVLAKGKVTRVQDPMAVIQFAVTGSPDHKAMLSFFPSDPSASYCALKIRTMHQSRTGVGVCFYSERITNMRSETLSQPYSNRFTMKPIFRKYYEYTRRSLEMSLSFRSVNTGGLNARKTTNDAVGCSQKPPKTWERYHFHPTQFYYYQSSLYIVCISLGVAFIVLMFEQRCGSFRQRNITVEHHNHD